MEINILATGSSGNCYRISDGKASLLLDAGIPFKQIQAGLRYKTGNILGCLVTHRHGDHSKAIPELVRRGVPVYGNDDTCNLYKGVHAVRSLRHFLIGCFDIVPFDVHHDVPCFGYEISLVNTGEKLLYVTDTAYVTYTFKGLTHLLIEANYSQDIIMDNARGNRVPAFLAERVIKTHMSIEMLLQLLANNDMSKVKQIYLLHLSGANSDAAEFKKLVQEQTGAEVYVF